MNATHHPWPVPVEPVTAARHGTASQRLSELLASLSVVLDSAERRTERHALRAAYVAGRVATKLSLPDDQRAGLLYAGLLCDVGTVGPEADAEADAVRTRRSGMPALPARRPPRPTSRGRCEPGQSSRPWDFRSTWRRRSLRPMSAGTDTALAASRVTGSRARRDCLPSPRPWRVLARRPRRRTSTGRCVSSGDEAWTPDSSTRCCAWGVPASGTSSRTRTCSTGCSSSSRSTPSDGRMTGPSTRSR